MSEQKEIDCDFTDEIVCPYCGYEFSDSWECNPHDHDNSFTTECGECEKTISVEANITIKYSSDKLPCANGDEPHKFKNIFPHYEGKDTTFQCIKCSKEEKRPNPNYKPEQAK